jgi:thiol-disulfide isomerase/thioredoxin
MMNIRFAIFWAFALLFFAACGNEPAQSADHEAALPHNLEQTGNTTDAENAELAAAKGKSASLVDAATLVAAIKADTSSLLVVNFWKTDCLKCIQLQQNLQAIQTKSGEGKLRIISVNLDDESMANGVNLVLRKSGITSEVLQVKQKDGKWRNDVNGGWQGNLPALFIKTKDNIRQFHTRDLSAEELGAMLQPLLL